MNKIPLEQFQRVWMLLHKAPIAMAETDVDGTIRQLNPKAVQLMMPMVSHAGLQGDNLLDTLAAFLPSVRQAITNFGPDFGLIVDQEPYRIRLAIGSNLIERYFSMTIEKISHESLFFYFDDVTDFLIKVNSLRQSI